MTLSSPCPTAFSASALNPSLSLAEVLNPYSLLVNVFYDFFPVDGSLSSEELLLNLHLHQML
jgi:hypothetical protein